MRGTRLLLIVASVFVAGFAPAPFPRPERQRPQDATDVAGTWEFVECQSNGTPYERTRTDFKSEITKDRFVFVKKDGKVRTPYEMRLDATASPPSFTWGSGNSVSYVGSYRLEKDRLTMAFNSGSDLAQRPTDPDGKAEWRYVLRRIGR